MVFSRFRLSIIIQVLLIVLTAIAFSWTIRQEYMLITSISLVIVMVIQIIALVWFNQRIIRDLRKFVLSLRYDDVSVQFNTEKKLDPLFSPFYQELDIIIKQISEARAEKVIEHQYFLNTITHIDTGIIALNEKERIELHNNAALYLLGVSQLNSLNGLEKSHPNLIPIFRQLKPGDTELIKLVVHNEMVHLSVRAARFKLKNKTIKLLTLQNINTEIDRNEIESWQKLIRVLTHEIMNSVSPIKLLSGSLIDMFEENEQIKNKQAIDDTTIQNSLLGLKTIRKRTEGLSKFVETYRNLAHIPKPNMKEVELGQFLLHVKVLVSNELHEKGIKLLLNETDEQMVLIDEELLEQVLINLIKNAAEAIMNTENKIIEITTQQLKSKTRIMVIDYGPGIPDDVLENIFIPFYTTKANGSGIGLSLSRQIVHAMGGSLTVKSEQNKKTVFTIAVNC